MYMMYNTLNNRCLCCNRLNAVPQSVNSQWLTETVSRFGLKIETMVTKVVVAAKKGVSIASASYVLCEYLILKDAVVALMMLGDGSGCTYSTLHVKVI